MQTSTNTPPLTRILNALALRGYGWKRRKQRENVSYRVEWQDPATGQWYGEETALRLLKVSLLAEYGKPNSGNYRRYF